MSVRARILTGLHAGAEMELTAGEWNIGTDPLSDILLSDETLQPHHARLLIMPDGRVRLEAMGGQCTVDDRTVDAQGADVPLYARLRLGGDVLMQLGRTEEAWPKENTAAVRSAEGSSIENSSTEAPPAKAAAAASNATINDAHFPATAGTDALPPQAEQNAGSGVAQQNADKGAAEGQQIGTHGGDTANAGHPCCPPERGRHSWRRAGAAGMAFGLLLTLTLGASFFSPDPDEEKLAAVSSVLRANGQNPAAFSIRTSDAGITVQGAVATDALRDALNSALRGIGKDIHPDVLSLYSIAEEVKARITAEGARVQVSLAGESLRLSGYMYDARTLAKLLMPLAECCARVTFQEDIVYWKEIEPRVADSLRALHLEDSVKVRAGEYALTLDSAAVPLERRAALRAFERELTDMCGGVPPLTAKAAPALPASRQPAEQAALCRRLGIIGEGPEVKVTFDGQPFGRGAVLPNGMRVQDVRPDYVTLEQGNDLHYCPMP